MKRMTISKILSIIVIVGTAAILLFVFLQDFAWLGYREIKTDFLKFTPYFSVLKPQDRIVMAKTNYLQAEPVYFDLYLPRDFIRIKVEMKYKNEYGNKILLGPNLKNGWDLKPLNELKDSSNSYKIGMAEYDLADKNINNGKLRFMISVPEYDIGKGGIEILGIKVRLERKPIWQDNIWQNLMNYFTYVKNQY
ncbi:MAG: hypothetical protein NTZ49_04525 [Candidatus Parcubacteria bacterium]|nr:hypothetical protein [Candidatus Parcubacteria bacterium]